MYRERVIDYNGTLWDRHKKLKGVMAVVADNLLGSVPAYRLVLHAFVVIIYCRLSFFVDFWVLVCRFLWVCHLKNRSPDKKSVGNSCTRYLKEKHGTVFIYKRLAHDPVFSESQIDTVNATPHELYLLWIWVTYEGALGNTACTNHLSKLVMTSTYKLATEETFYGFPAVFHPQKKIIIIIIKTAILC